GVPPVPQARNLVAGEQCLQRLRHLLGGEAECSCAILVDLESYRLDLFAPLKLDITDLGIGLHDVTHLSRDPPTLLRIAAGDAELHRMPDRRPELQPRGAAAYRPLLGGKARTKLGKQPLAMLAALGLDQDQRI